MREELRKKILPNFVELIQATNLHEATDEFQSAGYITNSDAETVEHEKTMKMKNKVLINILLTKPDLLFEKLLHWLFREEHSELARKLAEDVCDTADFELESMFNAPVCNHGPPTSGA